MLTEEERQTFAALDQIVKERAASLRSLLSELDSGMREIVEAVIGEPDEPSIGDIVLGRCFSDKGRYRWRKKPVRLRRTVAPCGAKTRKGTPCQCLPVVGRLRCKYHGGMSTGPKTEAGRAAIAESNRRRRKANQPEESTGDDSTFSTHVERAAAERD